MGPHTQSFPGRSLRRTWRINPVTRVHDNDIRKQRKKERQALKKRLAEELKDNRQPFHLLSGWGGRSGVANSSPLEDDRWSGRYWAGIC